MKHLALAVLLLIGAGFAGFAEEPVTKEIVAKETPKVERLTADQWCASHDLPKDKCAQCDKKLIPKLKKQKDWCGECGVAESTCLICNPKEAKVLLDALRPAAIAK